MPAPAAPSEIDRHIFAHSRRAASSTNGSLRMRACSVPICSLTARSRNGLTSFETLSLSPRIVMLASATETCAPRLGSIRQDACSAGREVTVTLPRMSARWSSVFSVSFCTSCPRLPPSRRPMAPVTLPAWTAIWPVARNVPVSAVATDSPSGRPLTASGPRATVQPISAFCSSCEIGLSRLPVRSFGAVASRASPMALSAIMAGVTMVELRVTGLSGGTSTSFGRRSPGALSMFIAQIVPANEATTTSPPATIFPSVRPMGTTLLNRHDCI